MSASPLKLPSSSAYILIRLESSSTDSLIMPNLEKNWMISSRSASVGIPVTQMAVFLRVGGATLALASVDPRALALFSWALVRSPVLVAPGPVLAAFGLVSACEVQCC